MVTDTGMRRPSGPESHARALPTSRVGSTSGSESSSPTRRDSISSRGRASMRASDAFTERIRPSSLTSATPSLKVSLICAANVPGDRIE